MLSPLLRSIRITHLSLAFVGLMWVFPFLHTRHDYPWTTFDQEWWSVVLGLLATTALLTKEYWQSPQIPRVVLLPVALIGIAIIQIILQKVAYFEQGLLYILYLLFAALLMLLGAWLRRSVGLEKLTIILAFFLLIGAELSAALGVLQHFGWHTWFDEFVVRKISFSVYGNVAQPNHFANYIALGLASLGLLFQQKKLNWAVVLTLAFPLVFVLTLSGSRSSWLYLFMMAALAGVLSFKHRALRPLWLYTLALIAGFLLMHFVVQLPMMAGVDSDTNTLRRFMDSDTKGSIRLFLWNEAVDIFTQSPWLGVGFGQFSWHHFQLQPTFRTSNIDGLYNNAHSVVFQLAAETGIAGLLALFGTAGLWLSGVYQQRSRVSANASKDEKLRVARVSAAHWWGYAVVGVSLIHSLLEYPLWYSYFIAILAFLLGMLDETHYKLEMRLIGRSALTAIVVLGFVVMAQIQIGYEQFKATLTTRSEPSNEAMAVQRVLDGLMVARGNLLLTPSAEFYIGSYTTVDAQNIKEKILFNTRVMHFIPAADVVYRQAFLLAQDNQLAAAKIIFEQAIWSYPGNGSAHQLLLSLVEKDPAHFSALLEFANQKEQEHSRAIRNN